MKGISLHQPWAFAAVAGFKGNETRGYKTNVRGHVFIHATQKHPYNVDGFLEAANAIGITAIDDLARGAIIGTVEIVDCQPVEAVLPYISEQERALGDYSPGRFAWKLQNPVLFDKPIPAKGKQGWWTWDESEGGQT